MVDLVEVYLTPEKEEWDYVADPKTRSLGRACFWRLYRYARNYANTHYAVSPVLAFCFIPSRIINTITLRTIMPPSFAKACSVNQPFRPLARLRNSPRRVRWSRRVRRRRRATLALRRILAADVARGIVLGGVGLLRFESAVVDFRKLAGCALRLVVVVVLGRPADEDVGSCQLVSEVETLFQ